MAASWQELERAFIDDHQELSRGYREIVEAIEQDDHELAANIATRLDQVAGPHIEFEEHCLYPEVARSRGEEYVERLYREHADTVETLTEIEQHDGPLDAPTKQRWLAGIQHGLDHAASCGTLLSHLSTLEPGRQKDLLDELNGYRKAARRWSQLHRIPDRK